jgi:mono/diheme cytochrome c family protein
MTAPLLPPTIALAASLALTVAAQGQTLTFADRESSKSYTVQELLADPATREVTIDDVVYHRAMTYRAIPTAELLKRMKAGDDDYVQARATDNFSIAIPARLLKTVTADTEAFVAIENPTTPWPPLLRGKDKASAGPFYIVWRTGSATNISSEYWAYKLAAFTVTDSPFKRWPGLRVEASVAATDPIRRGRDRFVAVCLACHRFNGEGEGTQGPDLGTPMNPVNYFQAEALRKFLRDPASVRHWPEQKMPAFSQDALSDTDIEAIVAWLSYKAKQRR